MPATLSKSTFLRGNQCLKSLYLNWYHPELKDPVSPMQQAIFNQGHDVGKVAQQLFPGGFDAGIYVPDQYQKSIELTRQKISNGIPVIYEAGFATGQLHCFIDILVKDGNSWKAFEVKSSTQVKPVNILDAAYQYYVMTQSGLPLKDFSLVVLNNRYTRKGELDIKQLFQIESVYPAVLKLQNKVKTDVECFLTVLDGHEIPDTDIGPHCYDPYTCDFHGHCWTHVPDYSVFDIARLSADKKWELYRRGIMKLEDIPDDFKLNESQRQQVGLELTGENYVDIKEIRKFIHNLHFPLYFLDFESFQPAIPLYNSSRPYQQIVFQYSLHRMETKDSLPIHQEFLSPADGADPRIPFIKNLIADIGSTGDIIVFNSAFEAGRLMEIAQNFPEFKFHISGIVSRIKDLMPLFQHRHFYKPEMKGSYSIKQVLPAVVPGFSYKSLAIGDGGTASHAYMSLFSETDENKIQLTSENLLEYCKMDTLAMVEILKVLLNLAHD